jgi:hypothetical protein
MTSIRALIAKEFLDLRRNRAALVPVAMITMLSLGPAVRGHDRHSRRHRLSRSATIRDCGGSAPLSVRTTCRRTAASSCSCSSSS